MNSFEFNKLVNNNYVVAILAILVVSYGFTLSRIPLPGYLRNLFSNNIFRVLFLSLLLIHDFDKAPHVAIAIALIFVITLHYINKQEMKENEMRLNL
jgi:hypothetical protein